MGTRTQLVAQFEREQDDAAAESRTWPRAQLCVHRTYVRACPTCTPIVFPTETETTGKAA